ncbi:MAG: hypothetical protein EBX52_05400 [Proteobacteria bacterium]|nr:hypothetical protein [Pseudomonadota bacterium]
MISDPAGPFHHRILPTLENWPDSPFEFGWSGFPASGCVPAIVCFLKLAPKTVADLRACLRNHRIYLILPTLASA